MNDFPDRISDVLIFVGVAHSGLCSPFAGYWAAIFALLTAYVGMLGQAVGAKREFAGIMSKPWRMVVLAIGAVTTFTLLRLGRSIYFGRLSILDITCLLVILGCIQTMVIRLRRTFSALAAKDSA